MSVKEIFDKENEQVLSAARTAHRSYSESLDAARIEQDMTVQDLTRAAGVSSAQTYRVMTDPDANMSLLTMQRFAAAVGKKVVIELVDADDAPAQAFPAIPFVAETGTPREAPLS